MIYKIIWKKHKAEKFIETINRRMQSYKNESVDLQLIILNKSSRFLSYFLIVEQDLHRNHFQKSYTFRVSLLLSDNLYLLTMQIAS